MINNHPDTSAAAAALAEDQPIPMDPRVDADMDTLIRVAFAEKFGGFTRQLDPTDASWLWHRVDPATADEAMSIATPPANVDQLPAIKGIGFVLLPHLDRLCADMTATNEPSQIVWGLQRMVPDRPPFRCLVARVVEKTGTVVACGSHEDPATSIALAMLALAQVDYPKLHRELYPGKYLLDGLSG